MEQITFRYKKISEATRDNVFLRGELNEQQRRLNTGVYKDKKYKFSNKFDTIEEWAKWHIQDLTKIIMANDKIIYNTI
jgi:hypothetical protein